MPRLTGWRGFAPVRGYEIGLFKPCRSMTCTRTLPDLSPLWRDECSECDPTSGRASRPRPALRWSPHAGDATGAPKSPPAPTAASDVEAEAR